MQMEFTTIVGYIGTILAVIAIVYGARMMRSPERGGGILGPAYMLFGALFVPVIWFIILVLLPGEGGAA